MRVRVEAGCGMPDERKFNDGIREKNISAGEGFAHFDREDAEKF